MAINDTNKFTTAEMISEAVDYWAGDFTAAASACKVVEDRYEGRRVLVVLHTPTGRKSSEAGLGGCWNYNGTACS